MAGGERKKKKENVSEEKKKKKDCCEEGGCSRVCLNADLKNRVTAGSERNKERRKEECNMREEEETLL
jgi:hypothetical protein